MLGPWFVLSGAGMAVGALLKGLEWGRAVTDHMVEAERRVKTCRANRQVVRLDLYLTPDELLDIAKSPALERALQAYKQLEKMGEVDKCPTCKHPVTR
jgi:hypothetical protein